MRGCPAARPLCAVPCCRPDLPSLITLAATLQLSSLGRRQLDVGVALLLSMAAPQASCRVAAAPTRRPAAAFTQVR